MPDYMRRLKNLTRDRRTNPSEVPLASAIECDAGYIVGVDACEICGATDGELCRGRQAKSLADDEITTFIDDGTDRDPRSGAVD